MIEPELSDERWEKIKKHLPRRAAGRRGRPRVVDDRACVEAALWVLRSGARWKDVRMNPAWPSPATCWRRVREWEEDGTWLRLWHALLDEMDAQERIGWDECFADATFAPAKKGATASAALSGARAASSWWWSTARAFLWHAPSTPPARRRRK